MEFPKDNKLMLLFLSEKNPIWKELLAPHAVSQDNLVILLGIAHATLPNWKKGGRMDKDLVNKLFLRIEDRINGAKVGSSSNKPSNKEKLINKSGPVVGEIEKSVNNGYKDLNDDEITKYINIIHCVRNSLAQQTGSYDLAKKIGLSIEQCQKIVDDIIYSHKPLFTSLYCNYSDNFKLEQLFDQYQGIYDVFVRRHNVWLRGALRVRYTLKMRGGSVIRCKLNFPKIGAYRGKPNYWEYDGFMSYKDHSEKIFWSFEKRSLIRPDFFYFITDAGQDIGKKFVLNGTYLTTGQDPQTTIENDALILRRLGPKPMDDMVRHMHETAKEMTAAETSRWLPPSLLSALGLSSPPA